MMSWLFVSQSVGRIHNFLPVEGGVGHIFSKIYNVDLSVWIVQEGMDQVPSPPLDLCMHTPPPLYSNGGTTPFINCLKVLQPNILLPREGAPSQINSIKYLKTSKQFLFTTFHNITLFFFLCVTLVFV